MPGNEVHHPLGGKRGFRPAGAAIGCVRHLVGGNDPRLRGEVIDAIGAGKVGDGVVHRAASDRVEGPAIDQEMVAEREDAAVIVEAHLHVVDMIAGMAGAHEMLVAVLDPFDRPSEPPRQERNQQILRIDVALDTEASADVGRNHPHARLRHAERGRDLAPHRLGARIVGADHAPAFHRHRGVAMMMEAPREPVPRAAQGGFSIALGGGKLGDQIGSELLVHERCSAAQAVLGIDHRRQRVKFSLYQRRRVLGGMAALGDHHREGFADMAHLVGGEQGLLRVEDAVAHRRAPFGGQRNLMVWHVRQQLRQRDPAHGKHHPGGGASRRQIDRADARMRQRAAHESRVEHARKLDVVDILSLAEQQSGVLPARHGAPDVTLHAFHHLPAAAARASKIWWPGVVTSRRCSGNSSLRQSVRSPTISTMPSWRTST